MKEIKQFQPYIKRKYAKKVYKNIISGNLGPGIQTKLVEEKIEQINNIKNCICVNSGTSALMVAIKSLNLKSASTILAPAYSFLAAHNAARFLGYKIKLVDINPYTLCLDPNKLKWNKNISCAIFINHNGYNGSDLQLTKQFCVEHKIPMIEDSAQCLAINHTGQIGDIAIISFSVPKLATSSQGGAIITNNNKLAEKCRNLIDHGGQGWRWDRTHKGIGLNLRFNDIVASYLLPQLQDIKYLLYKRLSICQEYNKYIKIEGFDGSQYSNETPWMVIYRTKKADEIIQELKKNKIEAVKYYKCISDNPPYKTKSKFPVAEQMANQLVYLPSSLNLREKDIKRICRIIKNIEDKKQNI